MLAARGKANIRHHCRVAHAEEHAEEMAEAFGSARVPHVALPLPHTGAVRALVTVFDKHGAPTGVD